MSYVKKPVNWRAVSSITGVRFQEREFFSQQVVFRDVTSWGYPEDGVRFLRNVGVYQITRCQIWRSSHSFHVHYKVHTCCHSHLSDQWYLVNGKVQFILWSSTLFSVSFILFSLFYVSVYFETSVCSDTPNPRHWNWVRDQVHTRTKQKHLF
jgi:hypothetical protein